MVGDDAAPTSLSDSEGSKVVVMEPVVVSHLGLECGLVVGGGC